MVVVIANLFGLLSNIVYWASAHRKNKESAAGLHCVCDVSDIIQYVLLGSYSAILGSFMSLVKNVAYCRFRSTLLVSVISVVKIVGLLVLAEDVYSYLIVVSAVFNFVSLVWLSTQTYRWSLLCSSLVWVIYDFNCMAYVASALGVVSVISCFTAIIRYRGGGGELEKLEA